MMVAKEDLIREKSIPEYKLRVVSETTIKLKKANTVLVASTSGLPASQFQKIKKNLRGKAEIIVAKKSLIKKALSNSGKENLKHIEKYLSASVVIFISDLDAFELSALLTESEVPQKAKGGDVAPEDINVEPGPTELLPGPAISELGSVGLKVGVEGGKIAIKQPATIVKKGETITEKVAAVLGKLNITPMKVGFIPIAAYDSKSDKIYENIKIDKKKALTDLREAISKALGFATNIKYPTSETIKYFLARAGLEEKVIEKLYLSNSGKEGMQ